MPGPHSAEEPHSGDAETTAALPPDGVKAPPPFPEGLILPVGPDTPLDPDTAPPSFADFACGVYPFLELQPFHRAYYRVLDAFAGVASGG